MKTQLILNSFKEGFSLAHSSLDLFLVGYALALLEMLVSHQVKGSFGGLISFILLIILFGFSFSLPFFLLKKQQKKFEYQKMVVTTLKNARRLILPTVGIFLFVFSLMIGFVFYVALTTQTKSAATLVFQNTFSQNGINFILIPFGVIVSFFAFAPIYFSIEHAGFFTSLKRSTVFLIKHTRYLLLLIGYTLTIGIMLRPVTTQLSLMSYLYSGINIYIGIIFTATSLVYYQRHRSDTSIVP